MVRGDTLSAISKKYYGDANKYNAIFEANKPMLTHPDKIYPGQKLRIPPQMSASEGIRIRRVQRAAASLEPQFCFQGRPRKRQPPLRPRWPSASGSPSKPSRML